MDLNNKTQETDCKKTDEIKKVIPTETTSEQDWWQAVRYPDPAHSSER